MYRFSPYSRARSVEENVWSLSSTRKGVSTLRVTGSLGYCLEKTTKAAQTARNPKTATPEMIPAFSPVLRLLVPICGATVADVFGVVEVDEAAVEGLEGVKDVDNVVGSKAEGHCDEIGVDEDVEDTEEWPLEEPGIDKVEVCNAGDDDTWQDPKAKSKAQSKTNVEQTLLDEKNIFAKRIDFHNYASKEIEGCGTTST